MTYYTVLGIFTERTNAEQALSELEEAGFNPKDMSIIMKDNVAAQNMAATTGATNVTGGALSGAATGAVVGGLAGLLIGVGALTIPGLGAFLVGGPIALALGLTGTAATTISGVATGAVAGGVLGALMGLGIPEEQAKVYEQHIHEGGILLAVPAIEDEVSDVKELLQSSGAIQIRSFLMDTAIHRHIAKPIDEMVEPTQETTPDTYDDDIRDEEEREYASQIPSYAYVGVKGGRTRSRLRDVLFGKEKTPVNEEQRPVGRRVIRRS